ncbi:MAG: hypothetical protein HXY43_24115 [Fischerella sp.]|uniref:hypothetical protein n=1 Tax=Fischerella sp. TaxID=1191 RepID=UPI0017CA2734|nr:hypothetical protein [Fischerella sp.]NWF62250.1 hypothetical protein [Fischerella sp.]
MSSLNLIKSSESVRIGCTDSFFAIVSSVVGCWLLYRRAMACLYIGCWLFPIPNSQCPMPTPPLHLSAIAN